VFKMRERCSGLFTEKWEESLYLAHRKKSVMHSPPVTISPLQHRCAHRVKVECPFEEAGISQIKKVKGSVKSGANAYATLHTLRHSYATHCMEQGQSLKFVQEALGHSSIKTTEIYLHLTSDALKRIKSPINNLKLK